MKSKQLFKSVVLFMSIGLFWACSKKEPIPQPVAGFTYELKAKGEVAFKNNSETANSYLWSFGDSTKSTEANPTHTYKKNGDYSVTLIARGDGGSDTLKQQITISNLPISNLNLFVVSNQGAIFTLNATTGVIKTSAKIQTGWIFNQPVYYKGNIYASSSNKFYCLDAKSGKIIWNYSTGTPSRASTVIDNATVYVGLSDGRILALDAASGKLKWEVQTGGQFVVSPVVQNGILYINNEAFSRGKVYAINTKDGSIKWNFSKDDEKFSSRVTIANKMVYVCGGSTDNYLYTLDIETGKLLKTINLGGFVWDSNPTISKDKLYVMTNTKVITCLDLITAKVAWSYNLKTDSQNKTSPLIVDNTVIVTTTEGVSAFDAQNGNQIWKYNSDNQPDLCPTYANGVVYIYENDLSTNFGNKVVALDAKTGKVIFATKMLSVISNGIIEDETGKIYHSSESGYIN